MSTKTVRMNDEDERLLERVKRLSGLSASDALKRGLRLLDEQLQAQPSTHAADIYHTLNLGPGGDACGPARESRRAAAAAIRKRAGR